LFDDRPGLAGSRQSIIASIQLAGVMAMMVLAGDAQLAFHVAMIAGVWLILMIVSALRKRSVGCLSVWRIFGCLALSAVLAVGLAAVQVLPSVQWSQSSERNSGIAEASFSERIAQPDAGSRRDAIYQFSLPPWQLAELVWPNVLGKLDFTSNWRWSDALPGAGRVWTGSLYVGSILFLLAMSFVVRCKKERTDILLIAIGGWFLLGSFGWYGLGWLLNEFNLMRDGTGLSSRVGHPTGGVYWWMECLIPGYDSFRYPAKLYVVASLAICLLGGRGLDRMLLPEHRGSMPAFVHRLLKILIPFSILAAIVFQLYAALGASLFELVNPAAAYEIAAAMWHTAFVLGSFWLAISAWSVKRFDSRWIGAFICMLSLFELVTANQWTISTTPLAIRPDQQERESTVSQESNFTASYRPVEMEAVAPPSIWGDMASQLALDRRTLYPKHHLVAGQRLIGSYHSVYPLDTSLLLNQLARLDPDVQARVLADLSVDSRVLLRIDNRTESWPARPRFYLATGMQAWPAINPRDREAVRERTREFVQAAAVNSASHGLMDDAANLEELEVIAECDLQLMPKSISLRDLDALLQIDMDAAEPVSETRIHLKYSSQTPQLLVVADYYDQDWVGVAHAADGSVKRLPQVRVNRIQRGYVLPAGDCAILIEYRPSAFRRGAWISGISWFVWLVLLVTMIFNRRGKVLPD